MKRVFSVEIEEEIYQKAKKIAYEYKINPYQFVRIIKKVLKKKYDELGDL